MNLPAGEKTSKPVLALDIGGGTQDLLVWDPAAPMENAVQCILPSPTVMVARRIREATGKRKPIFLTGRVMGGGPSSLAVLAHLQAGLPVYALPEAALTLRDDLDQVSHMGVQITETAPEGSLEILLGDIQEKSLIALFQAFGLDLPETRLVAVQDHGFAPGQSNRRFRFRQWEEFLAGGRPLESLLYRNIPPHLTRMEAVKKSWPEAQVMDTGAAAVLGALEDERVQEMARRELLIVNIGNEHTLAAWMIEGGLAGILEHHTARLQKEKLMRLLIDFANGRLENEQVLADQGHGCLNRVPWRGETPTIVVTGPQSCWPTPRPIWPSPSAT